MSDENSQWVPRDPGTRPEAWTDQAQQAPYVSGAGQAPTSGAAPQAPSAAPSAAETEQLPRVQEGAWLPGADETAQLPRVDGAALPLSAQETMQLPRVQETMQLPRVQETAQLPSATAGQLQSAASPAYGQPPAEAGPAYGQFQSEGFPAYGQPPAEAGPAYGQAGFEAGPAYGQTGFEAGPAYGQTGFEAGPAYGQFQSEGSPAYGQPPAEAGPAYGQFQSEASPAYGQPPAEAGPAYGQAGFEAGPAYGQFQSEGSPACGQPPAEAGPAYGQEAPGGDGPHDFPQPVGQMPLQQGAPEYAPVTGAPEYAPVTGAAVVRKGPGWLALVASMLVTALVTAGGLWFVLRPDSTQDSSAASANGGTVASVASADSAPDWQAVASAVSPAVVTIQVQSSSSTGMGSGVVYDAKGDIVTNYHVIAAAVQSGGKIQVTLADGRIYDAEVVGHDRTTDLAVIRLVNPPSDLTVARFGSSSHLTVGAPVMAIGAPLGLSKTVTTGIVSALNRPVEVAVDDDSSKNNGQGDSSDPFGQQKRNQSSSDTVITNAIQVDASLNPGNSGGPLFDQTGAVVGINSSIKSVTSSDGQAGSIGLGFAIPSDLVTSVADQLIAKGTVSHAVLGVNVTTAAVSVGGDTYAGAEIADVTSGGAADKAGLRKGDVITQVEGQEVSSAKQLTGYIRRYKGGDTVKLTYVRDGASHEVQVALQAK